MRFALFTSPFMSGWLDIVQKNVGVPDVYPHIKTAPAASVLPYRRSPSGVLTVLLIKQSRPELENAVVIKTIGGYLRTSLPEQLIHDQARAKAGVTLGTIERLRESSSYAVAQCPVEMYLAEGWDELPSIDLPEGISRYEIPLTEAVRYAIEGKFFDPCTVESVFILATREWAP